MKYKIKTDLVILKKEINDYSDMVCKITNAMYNCSNCNSDELEKTFKKFIHYLVLLYPSACRIRRIITELHCSDLFDESEKKFEEHLKSHNYVIN